MLSLLDNYKELLSMVVDCHSLCEHWINLFVRDIKCGVYVKEEERIHQRDKERQTFTEYTL